MSADPNTLEPGDIVEIKYRVWRNQERAGEHLVEKWIAATVIDCEDGSWPLVRLADGQMTEIRPFMPLRSVIKARRALAA